MIPERDPSKHNALAFHHILAQPVSKSSENQGISKES